MASSGGRENFVTIAFPYQHVGLALEERRFAVTAERLNASGYSRARRDMGDGSSLEVGFEYRPILGEDVNSRTSANPRTGQDRRWSPNSATHLAEISVSYVRKDHEPGTYWPLVLEASP
jgi:hypothetical protein